MVIAADEQAKSKKEIAHPEVFHYNQVNWYVGTDVATAQTADEACEAAGLDWEVAKQNIYNKDGNVIPGYFANTRLDTGAAIGVVRGVYRVYQNKLTFSFGNSLLDNGVILKRAGEAYGGKRVYLSMLAQGEYTVGGEDIDLYLTLVNSHDGSTSVQIVITPVFRATQSMIHLKLSAVQRRWALRHVTNMAKRIDEARSALNLAQSYVTGLDQSATILRKTPMTSDQFEEFLDSLVPESSRQVYTTTQTRDVIREQFVGEIRPDVQNTRWAAMQAVAWVASHKERKGKTAESVAVQEFLNPSLVLDKAYTLLQG